jgi:aminopeptidase N
MYSGCETILCRQIFPHQDTPSVKATYDAKVKVDNSQLVVKMSANQTA